MTNPRIEQLGGITELDLELTGLVDANGARIANAATPIDGYDLATKDYVDGYAISVGFSTVLTAGNETGGTDIAITGGSNIFIRDSDSSISYDIDSTGFSSYNLSVNAQNNSGGGFGGNLSLLSGYGDSGGTLSISAGNANVTGGFGGSISITAGNGTTGTAIGGSTTISGGLGQGTGQGGALSLTGGDAASGAGGSINIVGGNTSGTANGGDISFEPGSSADAANRGSILLKGDSGATIAEISNRSALTSPFTVYTDVDIQGKLTVSGLIDPTGLVLDRQATVPGGAPAAGKVTFWVRDSDGYGVITNSSGQNTVLGQGGGGAGNLSEPTLNEDGYVAIASGGDLVYIGGDNDGYVLTWNASFNIWEPQAPSAGSSITIIPILGGIVTNDGYTWVDVGATEINDSEYTYSTAKFETLLSSTDGYTADGYLVAEARLFNLTTQSVVGSLNTSESNLAEFASQEITLASGSNIYSVQLRLSEDGGGTDFATCYMARVKLE